MFIAGIIACGLLADQKIDFWGQTLTNIVVWAFFLGWLRHANATTQITLTACLIYATMGEIFLSLIWGVYDYRLGAIPLFVPPGHALLFMLGRAIAARAPAWIVWLIPLGAGPFVGLLVVTGASTLDALLFALFLACLVFGRAKKLYAVMFVLALVMEIYGTWLGNWRWSDTAPWTGLTALNPPLAAGAFYCVLDLLVVATVTRWRFATQSRSAVEGSFQATFPSLGPGGHALGAQRSY
ncbi:MAG: hypothetical protein K0R53_1137 [Burkholderiales bacterium]|nr:hypothetical protein [Burkholderiales bacterium]